VTDHRDLIEILRSTGQLVTGAADAILQATQPGATITDTARCSLESHPSPDRPLALGDGLLPTRPSPRNAGCRRADARPLRGPLAMKTLIHTPACDHHNNVCRKFVLKRPSVEPE